MILSSTYDAWHRNHHPSVSSRAVRRRETRARVLGFYTHRLRAVDDKGGNLLLGIYRARNVVVAVSLYSSIFFPSPARLPRRARASDAGTRAPSPTIATSPSRPRPPSRSRRASPRARTHRAKHRQKYHRAPFGAIAFCVRVTGCCHAPQRDGPDRRRARWRRRPRRMRKFRIVMYNCEDGLSS